MGFRMHDSHSTRLSCSSAFHRVRTQHPSPPEDAAMTLHPGSRAQPSPDNQTHQHLDLGLLSLHNYGNQISVLHKLPSLWYFIIVANSQRHKKGYTDVLIPIPWNVSYLEIGSLLMWLIMIRSYWNMGGPNANMTGFLVWKRQRWTGRKWPCDDGDRPGWCRPQPGMPSLLQPLEAR